MKRLALAFAIAAFATASYASLTPPNVDAKNSIGEFFKTFNAQPDTFAEYRFLTSPAVQQDEQTQNLAAQLLATELSFLGRPLEALRGFPFRGSDKPSDDLPTASAYKDVPAAEWIAAQADDYRVVMVNEAHHVPQTRVLTFALLQALRARGYTHLAVEALANDGSDAMPDGYPVRKTGIYTREPVFAELLREARRLGYVLAPYEPNDEGEQSQQQRETGQAQAIADLLAGSPEAKVLVHAGYAHIGEAKKGLPDDARSMAMELARISGLALLTVDQTSTRAYEAGDIDTVGQQLAKRFAVVAPSVLVAREGGDAWSSAPGLYDVSVLLPAQPAAPLRPDWLTLGGKRLQVAIDMTPCIKHLPCLVEARYANEGDDAIPADQFLMLAASEAGTPLYLAPGDYRLRLLGNDGTTLAERKLTVPAHPTSATNTP
ncbi:MAG: hypothetical protein QM612_01990 [Thermomonas sp.]|uniref:hypothetical protein n=1 Tax=Thermomonas sp. TaxID=1971895 RepID=UPI0039E370F2